MTLFAVMRVFQNTHHGVNTNVQCSGSLTNPCPVEAISLVCSFTPGLRVLYV
jgi:hypothetical protein